MAKNASADEQKTAEAKADEVTTENTVRDTRARGRVFTRAEHDARAAEQGDKKTVGKYKVADLEAELKRNGGIPPGVSYSPYSAVPFVELTEEDAAQIKAAQQDWDRTVQYPSTVAVATAAGSELGGTPPAGPSGRASTPGDAGTGTGDTTS